MKRINTVILATLSLLGAGALLAADAPSGRQYVPSREIDILHLAIDATPDFKQRSITGEVLLRFKPIARPFQELKLDAVDLAVQSVTAPEKILGWQATDRHVIVTFEKPIPPDQETTVTIRYTATPKRGLYFRTPEMGYKPEDTHLFTQGETVEARHWFPCYDAPNEKFTSEVTCRVPRGMVVLSNGRLVSEQVDPASGLVAARWLQDKPHVTYLIALAAGYFKKVEDRYKDIPLTFYTPASQIDQAMNSFRGTKDMMAFFEEEIGVPYPWAKYAQVAVNDFVTGGMENTSLTLMTDGTLHTAEFENLHDSQGLVAHELAHQWFGDLVTCKDWANIWLNEGFATYYEHLYDGHKDGRDELLHRLYESAKGITAHVNETNAIVRRDYRNPDELFGYLAYPKGAWVLHMLRSQLGVDLYRRCIRTYVERHQFGLVTTEDWNAVLEELSGRSFDQFFDQWVYHAGQPELTIGYAWDEKTKLLKLTVQQVQKLSDDVLLFHVPLPLRFKTKAGAVDRLVTVREKAEDFYLPLPAAPDVVRVDPDLTVLAKVNFSPPTPMLLAQLADRGDMPGRLIAIEQLAARSDRAVVGKLKEVLNADPFHAVRAAAARALRSIHNDEALEALLASTKQRDARVRIEVVRALGGFQRDNARAAALEMADQDKNPAIRAAAIATLGAYRQPEVREKLRRYLETDSYREILAEAALGAMRTQDDPGLVAPVQAWLRKRETNAPSGVFGRGLDTLAWLARNEEQKEAIREYLAGFVNSPKRPVQTAALTALGTLGDPKALPVLEKFAGAGRQNPARGAAERAIASLRDARKPAAELGTLRNDLATVQQENRQLRKDLDELKKKFEALLPAAPTNAPAKSKVTPKPSRR